MTITKEDLKSLKRLHKKAVETGQETFEYKGQTVLVDYAKYLIEYLETL